MAALSSSSSSKMLQAASTPDSSDVPALDDDPDQTAVQEQLGYIPTNYVRVSARNAHGAPVAIQTYPLQGGSRRRQTKAMESMPSSALVGAPFPTLYWLTDPAISKAIAELERHGHVTLIEKELEANPELQAQLLTCHEEYAADRWKSLTLPDQTLLNGSEPHSMPRIKYMLHDSGIAGIDMMKCRSLGAVKCLHTHYAHYRSTLDRRLEAEADSCTPRTLNPVGQYVHDRLMNDFENLVL
eukprot:CAMPEP_0172458844 /NCGR_PEP_ID=MMETSP1065-20121228/29474_1 /TAXON_ID=265537 /ORGANISM="Amphiprora paludosa, Strain CCMP125" /LENGTH=240 /DNA_ID=CAMNT_0013213265 /DNA_START=59 /DNA_END=781 /DNA_ORIENTATION=-